jgi:hypothetical protein
MDLQYMPQRMLLIINNFPLVKSMRDIREAYKGLI